MRRSQSSQTSSWEEDTANALAAVTDVVLVYGATMVIYEPPGSVGRVKPLRYDPLQIQRTGMANRASPSRLRRGLSRGCTWLGRSLRAAPLESYRDTQQLFICTDRSISPLAIMVPTWFLLLGNGGGS